MTPTRKIGSILLVALLGIVTATGCSSDDDPKSKATTTTGPADGDVQSVTFEGDRSSRFCELARDVFSRSGSGDEAPDQIREGFASLASSADEMTSAAPSEIRSDVVVFLKGAARLATALDKAGFDKNAIDTEDVDVLNDPAYVAAGTRVMAYHDQVCVEPSAAETSADSTVPVEGSVAPPTSQ